MVRTAVLQRQESATRVGEASRIAFRKLAQTYLSEISVSNFLAQVKQSIGTCFAIDVRSV
ncbi:hypothetical protein C7S14_0810 [Burkholderia cepacia]|nr:hypothetical protein C7S14_0810 [Burkholderia cepacia]